MSTGLTDEIGLARERYLEVLEVFPEAPIALLRLGQAEARLRQYALAIDRFSSSIRIVDDGGFPYPWLVTDEQLSYFRKNVYRLIGYSNWCLFRKCIDGVGESEFGAEAVDYLVSAHQTTMKGLEFAVELEDVSRLENNLVYYYYEAVNLPEKYHSVILNRLPEAEHFQKLFDNLLSSLDVASSLSLEKLDTVVVVAPYLGKNEIAFAAASRVLDIVHDPAMLDDVRAEIRDKASTNAWKLLRSRQGNRV